MKFEKLYKACAEFQKLAQQKIVLDPKKKNIDFWSKFLFNALTSYSNYLRSPQVAKDVFDAIAKHRKAPAYGGDTELRYVEQLKTALQEAETKLQQVGLNPVDILKQKGMSNVNPNILSILKNNLTTLSAAQDFSQYQHYYLPRHGESKEVIEIDEPQAGPNDAGY